MGTDTIAPGIDLRKMPDKQLEAARWLLSVDVAARLPISVEGFCAFYYALWRRDLQPYAESEWIPAFVSSWPILECARGLGKTTDLSISWLLYCLGKKPWTSDLLVQANDQVASKTTALRADIIENFAAWKAVFPNIVPDKERGWGAQGYFIKDTSMDYGAWLEKCAQDHTKDPSFVGAGIGSADIRGMHPERLMFDDIHDVSNSSFPREREAILHTVRSNVLPVITKPQTAGKAWVGVACTPWSKDDAYNILYETGLFKKIITPLFVYADDGKYELEGKRINITWEKGFPIDVIRAIKKGYKGSSMEFAREYLCDRESSHFTNYTWYSYKAESLDLSWPMYAGVDYASMFMPRSGREGERSHFAECRILIAPEGVGIIQGGVLERCDQGQAETYVMRDQNTFPGWKHVMVESNGSGMEFVQLLQRNPRMKVLYKSVGEIFRGSKQKRQWEFLSPLFGRAALRVSDENTEFLNCLRSYLENYPNLDQHAPEWDVADSVVMAVAGAPTLSEQAKTEGMVQKRAHRESIWAALGRGT